LSSSLPQSSNAVLEFAPQSPKISIRTYQISSTEKNEEISDISFLLSSTVKYQNTQEEISKLSEFVPQSSSEISKMASYEKGKPTNPLTFTSQKKGKITEGETGKLFNSLPQSSTITPEEGVFSSLLSMLSISSVAMSQRTPKAIGNVSIYLPQSTTPLVLENSPSEDLFTSSVTDKSANLSELETMDTGMLTKPIFSTDKRSKTTPKSVKHSKKKTINPKETKTAEKHSKQSKIFTLPISPNTNVNLSEQSKTVKIETTVYSTKKVSGNALQSVSYSEKRSQAPTTYKTAKSDHDLGSSSNVIGTSSQSKYIVSSASSHKEVIVQSEKTKSVSGITTSLFQSSTSKPTISRLLSTEQPSSELSSSTGTTDVPLCLCTCVIDPDEDICSCVCTITKHADITTTARKVTLLS